MALSENCGEKTWKKKHHHDVPWKTGHNWRMFYQTHPTLVFWSKFLDDLLWHFTSSMSSLVGGFMNPNVSCAAGSDCHFHSTLFIIYIHYMYVCMYIYIMYVYIHIILYVWIYIYILYCMYVYIHIICMCIYIICTIYMICMYVYIYISCMYIYIYVCMCIYKMYVYI